MCALIFPFRVSNNPIHPFHFTPLLSSLAGHSPHPAFQPNSSNLRSRNLSLWRANNNSQAFGFSSLCVVMELLQGTSLGCDSTGKRRRRPQREKERGMFFPALLLLLTMYARRDCVQKQGGTPRSKYSIVHRCGARNVRPCTYPKHLPIFTYVHGEAEEDSSKKAQRENKCCPDPYENKRAIDL